MEQEMNGLISEKPDVTVPKRSQARLRRVAVNRKKPRALREGDDSTNPVALVVQPNCSRPVATPVTVGPLIDGERFAFRTVKIWSLLEIDAALGFEGNAEMARRGGLCGILEAFWRQRQLSGEAVSLKEDAQSKLRALWKSLQIYRCSENVKALNPDHCRRVFFSLARLVPHLVFARDTGKSFEQLLRWEVARELVAELENRYRLIV